MSKILVRLSIFSIAIYFIAILVFAWFGKDLSSDIFRFPLELILYISANDDKKYNCRYARFLALSIFGTDAFTYIDAEFNLVPNVYAFLAILSIVWIVTIITTIILGVRHFRKVRKLKKKKNEYEEYRIKK